MEIAEAIKESITILKGVCEKPKLESEILLCNILNVERIYLHLNSHKELPDTDYKKLKKDAAKRATHYPLEYITKKVSFYGMEFLIEEGVLIPRPETELIIDMAIEYIRSNDVKRVVEVGIGSGIISTTLATMFDGINFIGTDINQKAVDLAKKNAKKFEVERKVDFMLCNKLDKIYEKIDLLISNPPYINSDYQLPKNVEYEPKEALFGGKNGNEFVIELIEIQKKRKINGLICEIGFDQKESLEKYCLKNNHNKPLFFQDLAGLDRAFILK